MKRLFTVLALSSVLSLLCSVSLAAMPELRGYSASGSQKYIYVTFGEYFNDSAGNMAPVLWKVLGKGVPGDNDVSTEGANENDNAAKSANQDVYTDETDDVYCLMTEYIIDFHQYNPVRDTRSGEALQYKDSEMYRFLNSTSLDLGKNGKPIGLLGWLFTQSEIDTLMYMPERGYVSLPSRKGELFRRDYGFIAEDFREWLPRQATGTEYAFSQGLKKIVDHWTWYFTTDRRRVGFRWIVGDNGHTSVAGADREGGVRLVCYPHTGQLECLGGSGTREDPYRLVTRTEYHTLLKQQAVSAARSLIARQAQENAYAVSRAQAQARTREEEAQRLAAEEQAARDSQRNELIEAARTGQTLARLSARRIQLYAERTLSETRSKIEQLRLLAQTQQQDEQPAASFEASPDGMIVHPAE